MLLRDSEHNRLSPLRNAPDTVPAGEALDEDGRFQPLGATAVRGPARLLKTVCEMTTWFCDAYASWQKGAVDNANGRLRRELPRHRDPDTLDDAELQEIVLSHNLTPRKCLGFLSPAQALLKALGKDVQIRFA